MAKINASAFGGSRGKLTPEDIDGEVALVTISSAEQIEVDDEESPSGKRLSLCLHFEESGDDKALWLNKTQVETLVLILGDDTDGWLGKVVPVEVADVRFRGRTFRKVRVMAADEWRGVWGEVQQPYPYKLPLVNTAPVEVATEKKPVTIKKARGR